MGVQRSRQRRHFRIIVVRQTFPVTHIKIKGEDQFFHATKSDFVFP